MHNNVSLLLTRTGACFLPNRLDLIVTPSISMPCSSASAAIHPATAAGARLYIFISLRWRLIRLKLQSALDIHVN